jgi:2,4-didehydro-3-deoxy-L-rhamnonate hydrolase
MTWFALATYRKAKTLRPALVLDGKLYDMATAYRAAHPGSDAPASWVTGGVAAIVADWAAVEGGVTELAEAAARLAASGRLPAVTDGERALAPPIVPSRIFAAASNYIEHANEMGTVLAAKVDSNPYMFMKPSTSVIGPNETVRMPPQSSQVDWEVELGVVIGRTARRISTDEALDHVAGYTVVNDVSARDLNVRSDFPFKFDWFQGKCFDTFAPLGPWIVPRSCIADPQKLKMSLTVNDAIMQDADTGAMIFNIREQIAYLSSILTLQPGDVIATGTPTGVGMGRGVFLKAGDVMTAWIEDIGTLANPVAAEQLAAAPAYAK